MSSSWLLPQVGWVKYNVDGSVWASGEAACGGVLRDSSGRWLQGFCRRLGTSNALLAELWAIWVAVESLRAVSFPKVVIESDSKEAIAAIESSGSLFKTTNPKNFCVIPNIGIIAPQGTCDVTVSMQAQQTAPLDFQCKDKFLIQSTIAPLGASLGDIFSKNSSGFQEKKLRVALLPLANEDLKQEDQHPSNSNQIHVKQDDQDPSNSNPNEAAQLSLPKAIEKLNKEVEELKLNLSVMDYKLREPSMIMDFFLTKFSGPLAEQLRLMMEIEELKSRMNVMDLKLSVLPEKMRMQIDIIQILSSYFPNDIEEMDIVEGMGNDIEELKRKMEANNRHFSSFE
ncbi:uncharacterized protein LOC130725742 [Lotus japonicus]|uniref:uncharacterized protein LOC130725742 n=1 Tax=Lotus japonicus TaxID=34305 RepID=UPI0025854E4F|nr:uncharacterized protein LOC130725742 [Lotus japonicus]